MSPILRMAVAMQTIWIPVALPCAGKTTMYEALSNVDSVGDGIVQVSPDKIREEMYPGYEAGAIPFEEIDNSEVFERANCKLRRHIWDAWDVWFDATNITARARASIHGEATACSDELRFIVLDLEVPFDEVVKRNRIHRDGYRAPSIEVLQDMKCAKEETDLTDIPGSELWRLEWDGEWSAADDFDPPEVCLALIDAVNASI